jgi:hypothetical protein
MSVATTAGHLTGHCLCVSHDPRSQRAWSHPSDHLVLWQDMDKLQALQNTVSTLQCTVIHERLDLNHLWRVTSRSRYVFISRAMSTLCIYIHDCVIIIPLCFIKIAVCIIII